MLDLLMEQYGNT